MRLAFLTSQLTLGGGERQLVRTAAHLASVGAEVLVLSTSPDLSAAEVEGVGDGGALRIVGLDEAGRRARLLAARRVLAGARPDVLVGWLQAATVWAPLLAASVGIPTVRLAERTTLDGYRPAWRRARLLAARRADRVVANSEHAAAQWRQAAPSVDVRVARNFPPPLLAPVRFPPPTSPVRFVLVGRLVPAKGIDLAVEALGSARRLGLDASLVVVGRDESGSGVEALRSQASAAGVADVVTWRRPDLRSVADAAAWADVLLVPSRWEGQSNVVAEGLGAGLPVLASEAVVPPWPGVEIGLSPVGDAAALAHQMLERAWERTVVPPEAWGEWRTAAQREAEAAWLT